MRRFGADLLDGADLAAQVGVDAPADAAGHRRRLGAAGQHGQRDQIRRPFARAPQRLPPAAAVVLI